MGYTMAVWAQRGGAFCFVSWRRGREGWAVVLTADLVFHYDAGFREGFFWLYLYWVSCGVRGGEEWACVGLKRVCAFISGMCALFRLWTRGGWDEKSLLGFERVWQPFWSLGELWRWGLGLGLGLVMVMVVGVWWWCEWYGDERLYRCCLDANWAGKSINRALENAEGFELPQLLNSIV